MFNEKSGHPYRDNAARRINRSIRREAAMNLRVSAKGRRRRAQIKRVESKRYADLIAAVMAQYMERERKAARNEGEK